jgi:hypothetical protein
MPHIAAGALCVCNFICKMLYLQPADLFSAQGRFWAAFYAGAFKYPFLSTFFAKIK